MYNSLFLAGGFGTRFTRDVPHSSTLAKLPKGLLPLNGKPLLMHWLEMGIKSVYIVTNQLHYNAFKEYSQNVVDITSNKSCSNEERLGSIGDLHLAIKTFNLLSKPLLVIASDIFFPGFNLDAFLQYCNSKNEVVVLYYTIKEENVSKSGIIEMQNDQVLKFLEKPKLTDTKSRLGCPCFYYIPSDKLYLVDLFIQETGGDLSKVDASGKLIQWMIDKTTIYGYPLEVEKMDIGDYKSYLEADKVLSL